MATHQGTMLPSGSSAAAAVYPQSWMLLAPYGECEAEGSSCFTGDSTTAAGVHTSGGHFMSVYLHLVPPPAMSRVHVRFPQDVNNTYATVVAAHGDSLLIYICPRRCICSHVPSRHTGLLRGGDAGELVVAELKMVKVKYDGTPTPNKAAEVTMFHSGEWCVKRPRIGRKDVGREALPSSWEAHATVPLGEGLLCWVDFAHGVVFSDVFDDRPVLRFVPFPVDTVNHKYFCDTVNHKGKKRQVDEDSAEPHRTKRARKRNVRVTGPEWTN
ncbi:hypothetical protein ACP70R_023451 [Stipagrostis hirtigluma subsp. patula]